MGVTMIEDICPIENKWGKTKIRFEITHVSDVKVKCPGTLSFAFYRKFLFADSTGAIYGILPMPLAGKEIIYDDDLWQNMVGLRFEWKICGFQIHKYNAEFSVGEHVNGAEIWFHHDEISTNWKEISKIPDSKRIHRYIPFHFLDYEQLQDLEPDSPFDVLGTLMSHEYLPGYRGPPVEIKLRVRGSKKPIALAVWGEYSELLSKTTDSSGKQLKLAIKGARKKHTDINRNSHVGNTAEVFIIDPATDMWMFDKDAKKFYVKTFGSTITA